MIDSGFISAVLTACKAKGSRLRRARVLLRINSPAMTRRIKAHQLLLGVLRTAEAQDTPERARSRVIALALRLTLAALEKGGWVKKLAGNLRRPWDAERITQERLRAWARVTEKSVRKIPGPGKALSSTR